MSREHPQSWSPFSLLVAAVCGAYATVVVHLFSLQLLARHPKSLKLLPGELHLFQWLIFIVCFRTPGCFGPLTVCDFGRLPFLEFHHFFNLSFLQLFPLEMLPASDFGPRCCWFVVFHKGWIHIVAETHHLHGIAEAVPHKTKGFLKKKNIFFSPYRNLHLFFNQIFKIT